MAREFGWNIEEIKQLRPSELYAIVEEIKKQKLLEEYKQLKNGWAFLASVITNCFIALGGKKNDMVDAEDFISKEFKKQVEAILKAQSQEKKQDDWASLIEDAKAKGLQGPWSWK